MKYDLNEPAFNRLVHYRKTTKVGKTQKLEPMSKRAQTRARNILCDYPENVQSKIVTDCIDGNWESIHRPKGTLSHDAPNTPKPTYAQPPEIVKDLAKQKEMPNKQIGRDHLDDALRKLYGKTDTA